MPTRTGLGSPNGTATQDRDNGLHGVPWLLPKPEPSRTGNIDPDVLPGYLPVTGINRVFRQRQIPG
jgi:hypothetical protein